MRVGETRKINEVTGAGSVNDTARRFGINGTDLGFIFEAGAGRVLVGFGDTYGEGWVGPGAGPKDAQWRKNTLASSVNRDLDRGLILDRAATRRGTRLAAQLIRSLPRWAEHTVIPNSGISIDGVHYLHWMSILRWGAPGRWRTTHAGIASSADDGLTWRKRGLWWNPRGVNRYQVGCFVRDGDDVLLFGTTNGRFGPAYLSRVRAADVARPRAYTHYSGGRWVARAARASPVFGPDVGEMSVVRHEEYGWLAMHLDETRAAIVLRHAPDPWGPWSAGDVVADAAAYPGLYGGYLHPWCLSGGPLYWTMSQWDAYQVSWMRTELGR